jgi:tyrosyl-tRNA synthetase
MTTTRVSTETSATQATLPQRPELRKDFQMELERKLDGWLGRPGTEQRKKIEGLVEGVLGEPDSQGVRHIDLSKLDTQKLYELKRLEKASEDFETVFVKGMLSQMRRSSFAEDSGPMGDLAKDFLDQEVAASVSRSESSIGIGKTVFVDMAQRVVSTIDLQVGKD